MRCPPWALNPSVTLLAHLLGKDLAAADHAGTHMSEICETFGGDLTGDRARGLREPE